MSTAKLVGLGRFELPTSPLSGVRSNQLSYRPVVGTSYHQYTKRQQTSAAVIREAPDNQAICVGAHAVIDLTYS
jgi:hypothetical protein